MRELHCCTVESVSFGTHRGSYRSVMTLHIVVTPSPALVCSPCQSWPVRDWALIRTTLTLVCIVSLMKMERCCALLESLCVPITRFRFAASLNPFLERNEVLTVFSRRKWGADSASKGKLLNSWVKKDLVMKYPLKKASLMDYKWLIFYVFN